MLQHIIEKYNAQTTPYYAAARLWVDDIIDPAQTRLIIAEGIAAANHAPVQDTFSTGVFQV
jgi:acetyl-CoA carboxylase carboxyltransferase component